MRVPVGAAFSSILLGATPGLVDHYGFQLVNFTDDTVAIARTTTGVEELGDDGAYQYTGTADVPVGVYFFRWDDGADEEPYFDDRTELLEVVTGSTLIEGQPTFATRADIETLLGRDLTTAESAKTDLLLVLATAVITDACDRDNDWATALDPVPTMLRIICMESVRRALLNPQGLKSGSESLGAYSRSGTYADGGGAVYLTGEEGRLARSAVYGSNSGSGSARSMIDRIRDLQESRDVDEPET